MTAPIHPYPTTTPVFLWNWHTQAEVVINQGGTSSSKTYSILQVLALRAATEAGVVVTVVGGDVPDLKGGALRDAKSIVASSDYIRAQLAGPLNLTDRIYNFRNESLIEFKSYQDEFDARSGKRDYLFINEAQNVSREVYEELVVRTRRQTYLDYNPTMRFWAHDLIGQPGVELFISNFLHNPYLDDRTRAKILRYRTTNPARWKVYGLGLTGEVEGAIFKKVFPIDAFPVGIPYRYGLDFGYSNDPTVLVKVGKAGGALYGHEVFGEVGLSDRRLIERLHRHGIQPNEKILADAADPKAIDALRDAGFWVEPAVKGPDSVIYGIELINGFDAVYLTAGSSEWWIEYENYTWQKDKKKSRYVNKPIDKFNHRWDGMRYAAVDLASPAGIIATG